MVAIDGVVGNKSIPVGIRQDIVERTDGIPLFMEEMTKAVLEAQSEGAAQQTAATIPSPARVVPASLHASLMARLDRLGAAREVAQVGAALGREFSHALLAAVVRKPEPELVSALDRLLDAGLLFRQDGSARRIGSLRPQSLMRRNAQAAFTNRITGHNYGRTRRDRGRRLAFLGTRTVPVVM